MDNDVSAGTGSTTTILGHLALGLTLLAFGLGYSGWSTARRQGQLFAERRASGRFSSIV
ncbi:hypothetical protein ACH4TV_06615 [Streptomyces sp. NPDC020898]|uniref:hypothetical protein n=1 Tax=Streptomyces sp. NPDC020898 TaxID=3365101 RepID=UPI00379C1C7D